MEDQSMQTYAIFTDNQINLLKISKFNQHEVERSSPDSVIYRDRNIKMIDYP